MNTRIKIGMSLCAIALCGISFFAGVVNSSDRVAQAEADLTVREMKLKAKVANFDKLMAEFDNNSDKMIALNNAAALKLSNLGASLQQQQLKLDLQKLSNAISSTPTPTPTPSSAPALSVSNYQPTVTEVEKTKRWIEPTQAAVDREIKAAADAKWGTNYSMVAYEIEKQSEAFIKVRDANRRGNNTTRDIIDTAAQKWPSSYSMMLYEIERQVEAYNSLNR